MSCLCFHKGLRKLATHYLLMGKTEVYLRAVSVVKGNRHFCGHRSHSILNLKYKRVELYKTRDPNTFLKSRFCHI